MHSARINLPGSLTPRPACSVPVLMSAMEFNLFDERRIALRKHFRETFAEIAKLGVNPRDLVFLEHHNGTGMRPITIEHRMRDA